MRSSKAVIACRSTCGGMLVTAAGTASAQGYTGWIEHPYPSAGYWWCEYSGGAYWCQDEWGNWFSANPNRYNTAYAEMMSV